MNAPDLFAPADPTLPPEPKVGTQAYQVLRALRQGDEITPLDALRRFGCFRLAAVVFDLKAMGWHIKTKMVKRSSHGQKRFARYRLRRYHW